MARGPGLHTRIVAILKVGFPILAVGLILSVFVFRPAEDGESEIVFSQGDVDELGKGLQITNPTFTGTTREGDTFRLNENRGRRLPAVAVEIGSGYGADSVNSIGRAGLEQKACSHEIDCTVPK